MLRLIVGPNSVDRHQPPARLHGVASNLKKRQGLVVVEMVEHAEGQHNVEVVALDQVVLADALAYEARLREAALPRSMYSALASRPTYSEPGR